MTEQETPAVASLVIKRVLRAPVERVYRAWTDPSEISKWLVPNERWVKAKAEVDNREGGVRNTTMIHSDGDEFAFVGKYVKIEPNELISFTWSILRDPDFPLDTLVTVLFKPVPEGTELTLTHERLMTTGNVENTSMGWTGCIDMLERHLYEGWELGNPA